MSGKMTRERAAEFGAAWNSGNAELVASYFTDDGVYHASVGPDALGRSSFFTTKREGMGMGLSICRSIIESHDVTLQTNSQPAADRDQLNVLLETI
jgi:phosphoglycerate-specific signal transduction histidine kinase